MLALPRGPSQERKLKSRKARGTGIAVARAGTHISSRLEHLQGGVVLKEGGSGAQCPPSSPHSPSEPRLPPPGPGMQMSSKAGDIGVHWRWVPRPCTSRLNLGWGGSQAGDTARRRGPCGGTRGSQAELAQSQLVGCLTFTAVQAEPEAMSAPGRSTASRSAGPRGDCGAGTARE